MKLILSLLALVIFFTLALMDAIKDITYTQPTQKMVTVQKTDAQRAENLIIAAKASRNTTAGFSL